VLEWERPSGSSRVVVPAGAWLKSTTASPTLGPTIGSTSCVDSPLRFKVRKDNGRMMTRSCVWVANKSTNLRCTLDGVKMMCPSTCNSCSEAACVDAKSRVQFVYNDKKLTRSCEWVKKKDVGNRCSITGMKDTCRNTCDENC